MGAVELMLHERFLSSAVRVLDPEQADFFYVPAWQRAAEGLGSVAPQPYPYSPGDRWWKGCVRVGVRARVRVGVGGSRSSSGSPPVLTLAQALATPNSRCRGDSPTPTAWGTAAMGDY